MMSWSPENLGNIKNFEGWGLTLVAQKILEISIKRKEQWNYANK